MDSSDVFNIYNKDEMVDLLHGVHFSDVEIKSKKFNSLIYHCAMAIK